jgi:hypothetical protein
MRTVIRIVFAVGVLGGVTWLLYRFGPEMMSRCRNMREEPGETFGDAVADAIEEELAEVEV